MAKQVKFTISIPQYEVEGCNETIRVLMKQSGNK